MSENKQPRKKLFLRFVKWLCFAIVLLVILAWAFVLTFKKDIQEGIVQAIESATNFDIEYQKAELSFWHSFPNLSLKIEGFSLKDGEMEKQKEYFSIENAFFSVALPDLIVGNYYIKKLSLIGGKLYLGASGNSFGSGQNNNVDEETVQLELKQAFLQDVEIIVLNQDGDEDFRLLTRSVNVSVSSTKTGEYKALVSGFFMTEFQQSDLKRILDGRVLECSFNVASSENFKHFTLKDSWIILAGNKINFNGNLEDENYQVDFFAKKAKIKNLKHPFIYYLESEKINIDCSGLVDLDGKIIGSLEQSAPEIRLGFELSNGKLKTEGLSCDKIKLTGMFDNKKSLNPADFVLDLKGVQVENKFFIMDGDIRISDFIRPNIVLDMESKIDAAVFFGQFDSLPFTVSSGEIILDVDYERQRTGWGGVVSQDLVFSQTNGRAGIADLEFKLNDNDETFDIDWALFSFNNSDLKLDSGHISHKAAAFDLKMFSPGFFPCFLMDENAENCFSKLKITSGFLNLEDLKFDYSDGQSDEESNFPDFNASIQLEIDSIIYKDFYATDLSTNIFLGSEKIKASSIALKAFGGQVKMNGEVLKNDSLYQLKFDAEVKQADMQQVFFQLDNFGQTVISHKNIEGKTDANISFHTLLDQDFRILQDSLHALANFSMQNGKLINFDPIIESLHFLDQDELTEICFETLTNRIEIKNRAIHIPGMKINSNVLDFEAYGTHTFDNGIDYHIKVLLSEVLSGKAREKEEEISKFGLIDDEGYGRTSLFLHLYGTADDPQFKYDNKAVRRKIKKDFVREMDNLSRAFQEEFHWLLKNPDEKEQAQKRKELIEQQQQGEFVFEWEEDPDLNDK
jgi:AsmA-like C-terminal region